MAQGGIHNHQGSCGKARSIREDSPAHVNDGRLSGELREGPYGRTCYIDEAEICTAQEITDVVPVTRQVAIPDLVNAIAAKVTETIAEEQARTRAELEALRQELAATRELLDKHEEERRRAEAERDRLLEERDRRLVEEMRRILQEKKKPWWRFWSR